MITTAQLFITQSVIEVDQPDGYQAYGTYPLFKYASEQAVEIREETPIRHTDRTGYITFSDQSTLVAAKCKQSDNRESATWKIAEASKGKNGRPPKPPADPEGHEWAWIGGQDNAPDWIRKMGQLLARATTSASPSGSQPLREPAPQKH